MCMCTCREITERFPASLLHVDTVCGRRGGQQQVFVQRHLKEKAVAFGARTAPRQLAPRRLQGIPTTRYTLREGGRGRGEREREEEGEREREEEGERERST